MAVLPAGPGRPPRRPGWRRILAQIVSLALMVPALALLSSAPAAAQSWTVEGENDPSTFACDSLFYSNYVSGMKLNNEASGDASVENTVISKRNPTSNGLPGYWSSSMAAGKDPDTGNPTAFYADYRSSNTKLYKHVSGTNTVTDEIANGETRDLPPGVNWGGLGMDPNSNMLYGAQNGGTPKLFQMDLATGEQKIWDRGDGSLTSVPANDPVFTRGTLVPDLFVDVDGGAYYGIVYNSTTYIYRLDPATGTTTRAVTVNGPGSSNGFNNYGMAFHNGKIYLGSVGGTLYKVDPRTGQSEIVPGGNVQDNQVGQVQPESGSWRITDLASCQAAPNLVDEPDVSIQKTADKDEVEPGETVTYTITARNTGTAVARNQRVQDDLTDTVDDATYNNDAAATTDGTDTPPQPSYDADDKTLTWSGDIGPGETITLTYSVTVDTPPGGNKVLDNSVVGPPESNCPPGSTDPECTTETNVPALTIKKTGTPKEAKPGQQITYTVTVENTGNADATGATFTDDLSGVLDDATWDDETTATSGDTSFDAADQSFTWTGDVAKGATVTVTYKVTVDTPPGGDKRLNNVVTGPNGSNCPPDDNDPDCETDTPIAVLELKKTASPKTAKAGEKVTYTVTARNTGTATYRGATFTDDLTEVLDDATYNDDAKADKGTVSYAEPKVTWKHDLPAGQTATITYSVTVQKAPGTGDKQLKNAVTGPDDSTCPPGSTDPDCTNVTPVAELNISKTAIPSDPKPGDTVRYIIQLTNDGTATYEGARVEDDLTGILDDATYNDDATASEGDVSYTRPKLTWTGDVSVGTAVTIEYTVTVDTPPGGDKILKNAVTGPDGSNCETGSTDEECGTETPVPALKVVKSGTPKDVKTGDTVTYKVTVENTGKADYKGATVTDDLTDVIDDATYNDDATADSGTVTYAEPELTWTGDLAPGDKATITYTVTVTNAGNQFLKNTVTSPGSNCDEDSGDPDCTEELPTPKLKLKKTAKPSPAVPGGKVDYTVTITNDGAARYRNATYTDDLTGVLDDATYNNDASADSGTVNYSKPKLTWKGDVPAGETVTVTYSVTVGKPVPGDKKLKNTLTSESKTNCPLPMPANGKARDRAAARDEIDPDCATETPVQELTLAKTASPKKVKPGGEVTYTVTATNTGTAPIADASFKDDLSGVLANADLVGTPKATRGTASVTGTELTWRDENGRDLKPGEKATVTYQVRAHAGSSGKSLKNAVSTDTPGGGCPDGKPLPCTTDVDVDKGGIALLKKDGATGRPLPGAVFQLWRDGKRVGSACATDNRGRCAFTGLGNGTYYLEETAVPEGYVLPRDRFFGPYKITDTTEGDLPVSLTNKRGEPCKGGKCGK